MRQVGDWVGAKKRLTGSVGFLCVAFASADVAAQDPEMAILPSPSVTVVGGVFSDDFDDTDAGAWAGLRIDLPLSRALTLEPGVERLWWSDEEDRDEVRWMADLALRGGIALDRVTPYVGGNLGVILNFADDRGPDERFADVGVGGHGGVEVEVLPRLSLRGEVRARWFDRARARWLFYTAGIGWRF